MSELNKLTKVIGGAIDNWCHNECGAPYFIPEENRKDLANVIAGQIAQYNSTKHPLVKDEAERKILKLEHALECLHKRETNIRHKHHELAKKFLAGGTSETR